MATYFIEAESFERLGGWVIDQQSIDQMGSPYIMAHGLGKPVEDAETTIETVQGLYRVFVRTRDWTRIWNTPSSAGRFMALIDGSPLPEVLGTNGAEWAWQFAGSCQLDGGKHTITLRDLTGFNGRADAIVLTSDPNLVLPDGGEALESIRKELWWKTVDEDEADYDLIVVGGGIAGICVALSAQRTGSKVLLIHDRDVLGGCNSSEIRVCMGGGINLPPYEKLGNVVKQIEPIMGDPSIFGSEYYEDDRKRLAFEVRCDQFSGGSRTGSCTLALGEHAVCEEMVNDRLTGVTTLNIHTGMRRRYHGRLFADCTGDAVIARRAGCEVMYGREGRDVFGEELAGEKSEPLVMGHSLRWYSEKEPVGQPFPEIDWGLPFTEKTCYHVLNGDWEQETGFRRDMAEETEYIRDYGLRAIFSNWNYQKNLSVRRGEYVCDAIKWISPLGGKRESYRVVGDHILTEQDIEGHVFYADRTACMTWSIDIHFPEPDNEGEFGEAFRSFAYHRGYSTPYAVPYRCLYARDVRNLFLGGRIVSASHVAFSAIRVMRTLGALGEVVGLAASICRVHGIDPRQVYTEHLDELMEAMTNGVPCPDAFSCGIGEEEAYHFKDIGWIHFHPYSCDSPDQMDKFKRNILALQIKHKYPFPEGFWED